MPGIIARRIAAVVTSLAEEESVIALQGPRAVGKTTLLRAIASAKGVEVVDLDDVATREAAAADPSTFVSGPAPVCIDEYQHVPDLLDSIKAKLNRDSSPGRFIITGSTRHDALPRAAQALTGRLHLLTIYPFSQGEIGGIRENLVEVLFGDASRLVTPQPSSTSREDYIRRVVTGGFPMALGRSEPARNRWFDDYVTLSLERDVAELSRIRQRRALPGLLRLSAGKLARREPTSLQEFGHLFETFVVGEVRKQVSWMEGVAGCGHWRTHDGSEVDLVIEREDGGIVGIEVKAGSRVQDRDLGGLRILKGELGDAFVAGAVLYTGPRAYTVEEPIHVAPADNCGACGRCLPHLALLVQ